MKFLFAILCLGFSVSCANGPCPHQTKGELPTPEVRNGTTSDSKTAAAEVKSATPNASTASVYKPDGSKQCSKTSGVDLKVGEKELKKAGIKISRSYKGTDGMMHSQVCGAATGNANVYEIQAADLPKALKLGFKKLNSDS